VAVKTFAFFRESGMLAGVSGEDVSRETSISSGERNTKDFQTTSHANRAEAES
jgi:hypothetical protein